MMSKFVMRPDVYRAVTEVLGREPSEDDWHQIPSFADFSNRDIEEFELLGRASGVYAISYIRYRLEPSASWKVIDSFYNDVVRSKVPVDKWLETLSD